MLYSVDNTQLNVLVNFICGILLLSFLGGIAFQSYLKSKNINHPISNSKLLFYRHFSFTMLIFSIIILITNFLNADSYLLFANFYGFFIDFFGSYLAVPVFIIFLFIITTPIYLFRDSIIKKYSNESSWKISIIPLIVYSFLVIIWMYNTLYFK